MMTHQELAAWQTVPFSGPAERIAAYADPQYHSIHGEAYRQALIVKEALSLPADANAPELRGLTIQMSAMGVGENLQTLEQELAASPLKGVLAVNESRLGLSGRDSEADALRAFDENGKQLQKDAEAVDAKAQALGDLVFVNGSFRPRGK